MRDDAADAQVKRIKKLRARWHGPLGLLWWEVTDVCERGCIEHYPGALATAYAQWEYRKATITWDLGRVADADDAELEWAFVHEAMHIHLSEMRGEDVSSQHEERVATDLAHAFIRTREAAKRKKAKK